MSTINEESLTFGLCQFITEVKKMDGSDFPGKTLYDIIICVQLHLETLSYSWKLLNEEKFKEIRFTLDNTMKKHTSDGIGVSVWKAQILSSFDEDLLWNLGLFGTSSPTILLNTVVFLLWKGCALSVGKEHRVLRSPPFKSQFKFLCDGDVDGQIFIRYTENIGLKMNKGGLKHWKVELKTVDIYAIKIMRDALFVSYWRMSVNFPKIVPERYFICNLGPNFILICGISTSQLVSISWKKLLKNYANKLEF